MDKNSIREKITEALSKSPERKFRQTLELIFNFGSLNMEQAENKLNLNVLLPKGRGRGVEIGVFADGDMNLRAKKLSDHVLSRAELEQYAKSKRKMRVFASQCYGFITQPELMAHVGKNWGAVLAPRGKMPQPLPSNADLEQAMTRVKNTVRVKSKKLPTVQAPIGTADMAPEDLSENAMAVYENVTKRIAREDISSIYVKTTMGEPVKVL